MMHGRPGMHHPANSYVPGPPPHPHMMVGDMRAHTGESSTIGWSKFCCSRLGRYEKELETPCAYTGGSLPDSEMVSFIQVGPDGVPTTSARLPEKGILKKPYPFSDESDSQELLSQSDPSHLEMEPTVPLSEVERTLKSMGTGYHDEILEALRNAASSRTGERRPVKNCSIRKLIPLYLKFFSQQLCITGRYPPIGASSEGSSGPPHTASSEDPRKSLSDGCYSSDYHTGPGGTNEYTSLIRASRDKLNSAVAPSASSGSMDPTGLHTGIS